MRELVIRARDGDHVAFSALATSSIGRLTAAARLILRDEHWAQDAVQDTLFEAWRSLPGLRDPDRFDAWLHRLLVRACYARGRRVWKRTRLEMEMTPADEPVSSGTEQAFASRDQLEREMARLSAEQRAVLVLVYYADLPLVDAAHALGVPVGTIKSRLSRALHALRAALETDDRDPVRSMEPIA